MKVNKWTAALASVGVISGAMTAQAEESPVMTALSSTTISGFVDTSMNWNTGTGNEYVPNYGFNTPNKADGFNLNQVNLQISKPMGEGQWAAGYKVEMMFGPDAVGYNPSFNGDATSDFALKQAYVNLRAPVGNGLDFKVGVFDTIIGYEVANSVSNPNFSRSWGWSIEPTQHTGVLMSYQFNDMISANAGIANTLSSGINSRGSYIGAGTVGTKAESQKTWMGSVAITAPEDSGWLAGSTLYAGMVYGFAGANTAGGGFSNQNQANYYVGGTMTTPVTGLTVGLAWDYAGASANTTAGLNSSSYWQNVVGLYASYQVTEKMSVHARGEYAWGDLLYGSGYGQPPGFNGDGKIWSATGTLQYDLWSNVLTRLEVRWDNANTDQFGGRAPWDGGNGVPSKENNISLVAQIAYQF